MTQWRLWRKGRTKDWIKFAELVKTGPRAGRVDEARIEWETASGEFKNFGVKYSL